MYFGEQLFGKKHLYRENNFRRNHFRENVVQSFSFVVLAEHSQFRVDDFVVLQEVVDEHRDSSLRLALFVDPIEGRNFLTWI